MSIGWKKKLLLGPEDLPPSRDGWEVVGAFNPGAALVGGKVVLLVRVAERPCLSRPGWVALPRWDAANGPTVDWAAQDAVEPVDPRVVRIRSTGLVRLTFVSHLRVVWCGDGRTVEPGDAARFCPHAEYEEYGVEDPRITRIGDRFWITYVAVSRHGAATALASTRDFRAFQRHGIIFPPENKDVVLLSEAIGGRYAALHRPNPATPFSTPAMWMAWSHDLIHWGGHEPLFAGTRAWENGRVGAGAPPLRVADGWLEIYHGNRRPGAAGEVGRYQAAAMLLDSANPARVLRTSGRPILEPTESFEREGFVPDVVFPTGIVERGDRLLVYYGAGDKYTAVAEALKHELIKSLAEA